MDNIPRAEDMLKDCKKVFFQDSADSTGTAIEIEDAREMLIKFARLHVQAALEKFKIEVANTVCKRQIGHAIVQDEDSPLRRQVIEMPTDAYLKKTK